MVKERVNGESFPGIVLFFFFSHLVIVYFVSRMCDAIAR